MKPFLSLLLILTTTCALAQTYSGPESVEFDYANNRWLISNTQSHQVLARDSNGVLTIFTGALTSGPYGIEIVGDTLFCCSGAAIKGFLLSDASLVFDVNIGASFLNGITHDNSGNLYSTDFSTKTIHKTNIASQSDTIIASGLIQTPNGIIFDEYNNRCVFVNWGSNAPIKAIRLDSNIVTTIIPTSLGSCDGIARDGQGNYYVSNWSNQTVVKFDSSFLSPPVTVASSLHNPADIFYNTATDTLGIPNAGDNTVVFVGFGTVAVPEVGSLSFSMFPNPAEDLLTIQFDEVNDVSEISICDLTGKIVLSKNVSRNEKSISLNISALSAGNYLVSVIPFSGPAAIKKLTKK